MVAFRGKVRKNGNSFVVTIPPSIMENLSYGDLVDVSLEKVKKK